MTSKTVNDSHHLYLDNYMGYIRFLLGNRSGAWRPFQIRGEIGCTPGGYRDNTDCEPFTLRKSATLIGSFTPSLTILNRITYLRATIIQQLTQPNNL